MAGAGRTYSLLYTGSLPLGINLSTGGVLSGTPTTEGTFEFTILATDTRGCTGKQHYWVASGCPTISLSPTTLPRAVVGQVYNKTFTASNGTAPYNFVVLYGSLPPGLNLTPGGILSGTSTKAGTFGFYIDVKDSYGCGILRFYNLVVTR